MMKKILISVLFIALVGGAVGIYLFNKKVPSLEHQTADFILTANELYDAFEKDENQALKKFENKVLEVRGVVNNYKEADTQSNLTLKAENALSDGINCSFKNALDPSLIGKEVVVKGRCQGYLMDVILNNCNLIKSDG